MLSLNFVVEACLKRASSGFVRGACCTGCLGERERGEREREYTNINVLMNRSSARVIVGGGGWGKQ